MTEGAPTTPSPDPSHLAILHLVGTLDSTRCDALRARIESELAEGRRRFILNFHDVRHLDSTGIGTLVGIQHRIESEGGSVVFTRVSETLREIFEVSSLDRVLHLVDDALRDEDFDAADVIREIALPLRRRLEDVWEEMRGADAESVHEFPDDVTDFLVRLAESQRSLQDTNRILRDLLLGGESDLERSEQRYRQLFEGAAEALLVIDAETGQIIEANHRAAELAQRDRATLLGQSLTLLIPELERLSRTPLLETLRRQATLAAEAALHLVTPEGDSIPIRAVAGFVGEEGDSPLLLHLQDISVFRRVEENLQRQISDLTTLTAMEQRLATSPTPEALLGGLHGDLFVLLETREGAVLQFDSSGERIVAAEWSDAEEAEPVKKALSVTYDGALTGAGVEVPVDVRRLMPLVRAGLLPEDWPKRARRWAAMTLAGESGPLALIILSREVDKPWQEADAATLGNLRQHAALALERLVHLGAIDETRRRYEQLFERSRDAIGLVDLSTNRIRVANSQLARVTGAPPEEIPGSSFLNVVRESEWKSLCDNLHLLAMDGERTWECGLADHEEGSAEPLRKTTAGETGSAPRARGKGKRSTGRHGATANGKPTVPAGRWVQIRASVVETNPTPLALLILIDVTERRLREQEIRSLSQIAMTNPNLVLKVDASGKVVHANPAVHALMVRLGGTGADARALLPRDLPARLERLRQSGRPSLTFEQEVSDHTLLVTACLLPEERSQSTEGSSEPAEKTEAPPGALGDGGAILHAVDITVQKELERAMACSDESFRLVVDTALEGILVLSGGMVSAANASLARLLGCTPSSLVGRPLRDLVLDTDWPHVAKALSMSEEGQDASSDRDLDVRAMIGGLSVQNRRPPGGEPDGSDSEAPDEPELLRCRLQAAHGSLREVRLGLRPGQVGGARHILIYVLDETETTNLRRRVQRLERLAVVGLMAREIAEDLDGALTAIQRSLLDDSEEPEGLSDGLGTMEEVLDRGQEIAVRLAAMADPRANGPCDPLDVSATLASMRSALERFLGGCVRVHLESRAKTPEVRMTPADLWHIALGIGSAIHHAQPTSRALRVRVSDAVLGEPELRRMPMARAGENICLDFTGLEHEPAEPELVGMPVAPNIEGDAPDLWLSMLSGVLEKLGAVMTSQAEEGRLTRIRVFLPLATEESEVERPSRAKTPVPAERAHRHQDSEESSAETPVLGAGSPSGPILVVDDDMLVRNLIVEILEDAGFEVLAADNGAAGLQRFTQSRNEIAGIVLDIMMPVMDGTQAFRRIREIDPTIPILISSGFSNESETRELLTLGHADFVTKPFRREILVEKLETLIAERGAAPVS